METLITPPEIQSPYYTATGGSSINLFFHDHPGQAQALNSSARFILVLAGIQSGKTVLGPWWLLREMLRCGPGDYLVAGPTFPLLSLKCLPEYKALFQSRLRLGQMREGNSPRFFMSTAGARTLWGKDVDTTVETRIIFGHGQDPDSLESATAKAAHLDEAGQRRFKRASWDAIQGRLSLARGRVLITTTPYTMGWLKREVYDRAKAGDPDYELVHFTSLMNPAFPIAEFEAQRERLPAWRFRMRYEGTFERPAGLIYDCFDDETQVIARFEIPASWPRYLGLDFGPVNTAGVFIAHDTARDRFIIYQAYKAGGRSSEEHVKALHQMERLPIKQARGGSHTEQGWRDAYRQAGLKVAEPRIRGVEEGIDHVYALIKAGRLVVFDDLYGLLEEIFTYSRALDDNDETTDEIADKSRFHLLDALRYGASGLGRATSSGQHGVETSDRRPLQDKLRGF